MTDIRGLYAITDLQLTPADSLLSACEAALRGGARLLQYRDKNATDLVREQRARQLLELCHQYQARLIINDDPQLVVKTGAHGVHLGQGDGDIRRARHLLGTDAIIGISCHGNLALAMKGQQQGASYIALGRFFPSATKPNAPPASLSVLQDARQCIHLPLVVIGGLTPDNAVPLVQVGADALAVIHGLFSARDIEARARQFSQLFA